MLLLFASFIVNLSVRLRRVLGPRTLLTLLLGRYRRPVEEECAFLFLDLTDSTRIAEELGPLRFTDFKIDFSWTWLRRCSKREGGSSNTSATRRS